MAHSVFSVTLRKFGIAFLITCLFALILAGCSRTPLFSDRPPELTIKAGKQSVLVKRGGYSWRFLAGSVIADAPDPANIVRLPDDATQLAPGSELSLLFGSDPSSMTLTRWDGSQAVGEQALERHRFTLPSEAGTYLYSIRAEWSRGSSVYAFAVRLE